MTKTNSWQYKVVKSQRGLQGEWFRYPAALTTVTLAEARAYAEAFASEQSAAGVVGTRINVLTRGGKSIAEYRVGRACDVQCECGQVTGVACAWTGPISETVIIEHMPEYLRASHAAAGNSGVWPHNGALRLRVGRSCAEMLDESEEN